MSEPSPPPVGTLLRVTVTAGERRADLGLPGTVALAEIVPGLARTLGVLDAGLVHAGYRLVRPDGRALDTARSMVAQGVADGEVLSLEVGALAPEPRVYDDLVEAVADAVEERYRPWTARDTALGAGWAAVALVAVAAALLLGASGGRTLAAAVAGVGALLVLGAGAVVTRVDREPATGQLLVPAAGLLAGVGGLLAAPAPVSWGWPAAAGGGALLLAGLLGTAALTERRELAIGPAVLGLVVLAVGLVVALSGAEPGRVLAVAVAVVLTASIGVPWLALSATPLRVVTPRSDAEVLATPPPIEPEAVGRALDGGHRLQVAVRCALGTFTLAAVPAVVGTGFWGMALLLAGFTGVLLATRAAYARTDVLVVVALALLGLAVTLVAAAAAHPLWRGAMTAAVAASVVVVVAVGLLAPRARVGLARLGDGLEVIVLALLLPLGALAAGLV